MKTFLILLCVILGNFAYASTQTSFGQDKPPRIYVKSYFENQHQSGIFFYTNTWFDSGGILHTNVQINPYTSDENMPLWHDGTAGSSFSSVNNHNIDFLDGSWNNDGTQGSSGTISWPISWWPNVVGTETDVSFFIDVANPSFDYTNITTYSHAGAPIAWEHSSAMASSNWASYFGESASGKQYRNSQATIKLQTGGKATSKLRNLFRLTGSASKVNYQIHSDYGDFATTSTSIPYQNVTLGGYSLQTNGALYRILPDNIEVDVTPRVANVDWYTFNVGSPTKYHSYFEVFVSQPNPGIDYDTLDTSGHAFWQFKTDVPADALQYVSTNLTVYLNHSWGFYPHGSDCGLPGILANNDSHGKNIERVFYIGIPDLISGLKFTRVISNSPPDYCIAVDGYSCVGATTDAGGKAGITLPSYWLPWNWTPQFFGSSILRQFPGPLIDETPRYSK